MTASKVGYALTGSFCTFDQTVPVISELVRKGHDVLPIMSENAYKTDTKFGKAADYIEKIEALTGNRVIHTIVDAEPIGPKSLLDILIIAPCTSNTLAKLALGINDGSVTMAAKSHLRNEKPLLLAVATNDALGNSAKNIGLLLNSKHVYFVPMKQDNPEEKPRSVVADFSRIPDAVEQALKGRQIQPIYLR